ncbi:hypothetical protein HDU82_004169, partial [Entophlyctis luteolus]
PLVNVDLLNERVDAVEEVIAGLKEELIPLVKMRGLLHQLPAKLISEYLLTLDGEACGKNLKHDIFVFSSGDDDLSDALTKVYKLKEELRECQAQFADILVDIRKKLKGGSRVDFVSVSGTDLRPEKLDMCGKVEIFDLLNQTLKDALQVEGGFQISHP